MRTAQHSSEQPNRRNETTPFFLLTRSVVPLPRIQDCSHRRSAARTARIEEARRRRRAAMPCSPLLRASPCSGERRFVRVHAAVAAWSRSPVQIVLRQSAVPLLRLLPPAPASIYAALPTKPAPASVRAAPARLGSASSPLESGFWVYISNQLPISSLFVNQVIFVELNKSIQMRH